MTVWKCGECGAVSDIYERGVPIGPGNHSYKLYRPELDYMPSSDAAAKQVRRCACKWRSGPIEGIRIKMSELQGAIQRIHSEMEEIQGRCPHHMASEIDYVHMSGLSGKRMQCDACGMVLEWVGAVDTRSASCFK